MKLNHKTNKRLVELAGWYGASAIVLAYMFVSFGVMSADNAIFQLLNLTGALGIIVISLAKGVMQSVILNVFWALIAIVALTSIFIN